MIDTSEIEKELLLAKESLQRNNFVLVGGSISHVISAIQVDAIKEEKQIELGKKV